MDRYSLTELTPNGHPKVVHLQELLWQGGPRRNAAYLDWKYFQNPYLDQRYIVLAWAGAELVGMVGAFGALWETDDGDRALLPCLSDTVLVPEHRGGPLFSRMLDELIERLKADEVPWLLDFGDQPASPAMLMRGWKSVGPWSVAVARRDAATFASNASSMTKGACIKGVRSNATMCEVVTGSRTSALFASMAAFVTQLPNEPGIHHVCDSEYYVWRSKNPLARYFYIVATISDDFVGYLVAHRSNVAADDSRTPTTIVECEASTDDIWADLLEAALSYLPGPEVLMWARDIPSSRKTLLDHLGFGLDEPSRQLTRDKHLPNLLVRSTGVGAEIPPFSKLDQPSSWNLRAICGRSWR